jgi:hypothetical protein
MGFYIPEDDILHSHRRENLKSYISLEAYFSPTQQYAHVTAETIADFLPLESSHNIYW